MNRVNVYFENTIRLPLDSKLRIKRLFENRKFDSYAERELLTDYLNEEFGLKFSVIFFCKDISVYVKS